MANRIKAKTHKGLSKVVKVRKVVLLSFNQL